MKSLCHAARDLSFSTDCPYQYRACCAAGHIHVRYISHVNNPSTNPFTQQLGPAIHWDDP